MLKKVIIAYILCLLIPTQGFAQGSQASQASLNLSSQGLGEIVQGSGHILEGGVRLSITGMRVTHRFVFLTIHSATHASQAVLKISRQASGKILLSTGQVIQIVATGTGNLLYASGQLLAYIPNEVGQALLYSQRV